MLECSEEYFVVLMFFVVLFRIGIEDSLLFIDFSVLLVFIAFVIL